MLNLQEFIAEALVQIAQGVKDAQEKMGESGAMINPKEYAVQPSGQLQWFKGGFSSEQPHIGQNIEFDVAVEAVDKGTLKGGIGVAGVINIGYKAEKDKENSTISRIKFSIPMFLPRQDLK